MGAVRPTLPPLPPRIARLPVDRRGYPVPYFVAWVDGEPDHRVADARKLLSCVKHKLCWICGLPLGRWMAFVVGPMCGVNRIFSEPPQHRECAEFATVACPFLSLPQAARREAGIPETAGEPGGVMIRRNPAVSMVWVCRHWKLVLDSSGKPLFVMGTPKDLVFRSEGREATTEEIFGSLVSGLPLLVEANGGEARGIELTRRSILMKAQLFWILVPHSEKLPLTAETSGLWLS